MVIKHVQQNIKNLLIYLNVLLAYYIYNYFEDFDVTNIELNLIAIYTP